MTESPSGGIRSAFVCDGGWNSGETTVTETVTLVGCRVDGELELERPAADVLRRDVLLVLEREERREPRRSRSAHEGEEFRRPPDDHVPRQRGIERAVLLARALLRGWPSLLGRRGRVQEPAGDDPPDRARHLRERLVAVRPARDGHRAAWQDLQAREGRVVPVDGPQQDGDDHRLAAVVPLERAPHLDVVAVPRREVVGADEEQDDLRALEVRVDLAGPVVTRVDAPVVPRRDVAEALQQREVARELLAKSLVPVRVAEEDLDPHPRTS